jgi:hypothetical protein
MHIAVCELKGLPLSLSKLQQLELIILKVHITKLNDILSLFLNLESLHLTGLASYQKFVSLSLTFQ